MLFRSLVIFIGKEVNGSKSWFALGPFSFQPAEVSKISTSLFLAYIMSKYGFKLKSLNGTLITALTLIIPMILIVLEKETGSALVYCGFLFVLYREGMNGAFLLFGILSILLFVLTLAISPLLAIITTVFIFGTLAGIIKRRVITYALYTLLFCVFLYFIPWIISFNFWGDAIRAIDEEYIAIAFVVPASIWLFIRMIKRKLNKANFLFISFIASLVLIFSVEFIFEKVLQPHQKSRIENLLGIEEDLRGAGYNVHQSKIGRAHV